MSTSTYNIGDVPVLTAAFTVNGTPTDPTTTTVTVLSPDGTTATYGIGTGIVKDSTGNYHADLAVLALEGTYYWKWVATGAVADGEQGTFYCNPDLTALFGSQAANLATVYDVREAMRLPANSTTSDVQIQRYVNLASSRIQNEYGHFRPYQTNVAKRFLVRRYRARLFPYYLEGGSISKVVYHPESFALVLDGTNPDYFAEPYQTLEGCYTAVRLSPWVPAVSPTSMRFGWPLAEITGNWGYATVPDAVRLATVICVRAWMLRDAASYSTSVESMDPSIQPRPAGTYALPNAAREHLDLFAPTIGVV